MYDVDRAFVNGIAGSLHVLPHQPANQQQRRMRPKDGQTTDSPTDRQTDGQTEEREHSSCSYHRAITPFIYS